MNNLIWKAEEGRLLKTTNNCIKTSGQTHC